MDWVAVCMEAEKFLPYLKLHEPQYVAEMRGKA